MDVSAAARAAPGVRATPRLVFANQLRGVAAMFVVASHLVGVFWLMDGFLQVATVTPALPGPVPPFVLATVVRWFQPGPFGVGLFFLISGLVVPISLEKHSAGSFLLARALRIYPTYVAGVALQVLLLLGASWVWGRSFPYGAKTVLANALLVQDLAGQPSIDLVNWTLVIELHFYLLVGVLAAPLRRGRLAAVVGPAVAACVLAWGSSWLYPVDVPPAPTSLLYVVSSELPFLVLLLTGVLFNYHVRGRLGTAGLVGGVAAFAVMMAFAWWFSVLRAQFNSVLINYGYALVLFGAAYALRGFVRRNRVLDGLAAVSYPLYCVHAVLGYVVMKALMLGAHLPYALALPGAVLCAVGVAAVLHRAIERPSIGWGRALGRTDPV